MPTGRFPQSTQTTQELVSVSAEVTQQFCDVGQLGVAEGSSELAGLTSNRLQMVAQRSRNARSVVICAVSKIPERLNRVEARRIHLS